MTQQRRVQTQQREQPDVPPEQPLPGRPENSSPAVTGNSGPANQARAANEADDAEIQMEGVYIISVAAKMLSMHPQTLRKYERTGLVRPSRTVGMLRLYSNTDITRLRIIKHLVDELRLNLAGVETVLHMVERLGSFPSRVAPLSGSRRVAAALERELDSIFEMLQGRVAPPKERAK